MCPSRTIYSEQIFGQIPHASLLNSTFETIRIPYVPYTLLETFLTEPPGPTALINLVSLVHPFIRRSQLAIQRNLSPTEVKMYQFSLLITTPCWQQYTR